MIRALPNLRLYNLALTWKLAGADLKRFLNVACSRKITPYGQGRKDCPKGTMQQYVVLPAFKCARSNHSASYLDFRQVSDSIVLDSAPPFPTTASYPSIRPLTNFSRRPHHVPRIRPTSQSHDSYPDVRRTFHRRPARVPAAARRGVPHTNVVPTASAKHYVLLRTLRAKNVFDYTQHGRRPRRQQRCKNARIVEVLSPQGIVALLLSSRLSLWGRHRRTGRSPQTVARYLLRLHSSIYGHSRTRICIPVSSCEVLGFGQPDAQDPS
ncbi:hypothetical protein B0H12DRAFT_664103 [Mycena haematopus]|nr:hypothetical protein B0H12DRAFT_664103 [Mycena haematopus]